MKVYAAPTQNAGLNLGKGKMVVVRETAVKETIVRWRWW